MAGLLTGSHHSFAAPQHQLLTKMGKHDGIYKRESFDEHYPILLQEMGRTSDSNI
jgi:hypothetical protein